uniref:Uncharacterized protein n=1 Tax=viral metagenome TaxID=1070528 RepID=A0A6C0JQD6_9ZZZZ
MNPISKETLPLLSFIVGLGIAILLFHKPFQSKSTLSLPVHEIEGKVVKIDGKCFEYHAEDTQCEILSSK